MSHVPELDRVTAALATAELVAVSSGAGISKESGIPTFREAQTGLWARYDPQELATPSAFRRNPDRVWAWYMYRRGLVEATQPNLAHRAVAELESLLKRVVVLTQNIDGLHQEAGSTEVIELHGNLHRYKCFAACQGEPTLVDLDPAAYAQDQVPRCPDCGEAVRPDVVWFGESLPQDDLMRAFEVSVACDVMLVVGTSGMVQPAASLPYHAQSHGALVVEVNPQPSQITQVADVFIREAAGTALPRIVEMLHTR
jgi:NAD-dependent deacetylase